MPGRCHSPVEAERTMASMTAMLAMPSSIGDGDGCVVENGFGEGIALKGVLVGGGKSFNLDVRAEEVGAGIDEDARGAVGRNVDRDFDFDAAFAAEELEALVGRELRAAGEGGVAASRELEHRGGEAVGVERGVAVDGGDDARGLGGEGEAGGLDHVAADVHERAAADVGAVADVGGVDVEVAEAAGHGAKFADALAGEELAEAEPLRVRADHEGLADLDAGAVADGEQGAGFGGGHGEGLLAEDVLAGFGGLDRPLNVQVVGERVVDGVDVGVGEERFVGGVGGGDVEGGWRRSARRRDRGRRWRRPWRAGSAACRG